MSTHVFERHGGLPAVHLSAPARHVAWLAGGLAVGFLVSFVFADTLGLPRDLYYGIYAVTVAALFTAWARATGQRLGEMLRRRWRLALVLGVAGAVAMAFIALRAEEASARPGGLELAGAVLWRGVVYGLADGLLLSAFPILVVFAAFAGTRLRERWAGKVAIGLAALVASLAMTAAYHVGYSDFRSEKVGRALSGDVVWSAPTLLTLNPVGAPIAHAGLHVTAVVHSYETDLFLPPHE
ncbi:MAG TPA: hypothetical protein VLA82_14825 [Actinomycetota bacterium]|nr:hypothetical protein [Actinomycetota bacterium]